MTKTQFAILTYAYGVPALLALSGELLGIAEMYQDDVIRRREYERDVAARRGTAWYIPQLTVGKVAWRLLLPFVPVVNIFLTVFSVAPALLGTVLDWCERIFTRPLVPKRAVDVPPEEPNNGAF